MASTNKIINKKPTGFSEIIPLISFTAPKAKIRIKKERLIFETVSLSDFKMKTDT